MKEREKPAGAHNGAVGITGPLQGEQPGNGGGTGADGREVCITSSAGIITFRLCFNISGGQFKSYSR